MEEVLSASALLVRSTGALVTVTGGSTVISDAHQAITIAAATESVRSLTRYLETEHWIVRQD